MRSTQFRPHTAGVKTPRMLEVEARLNRTLEDDYNEFYLQKGWGQKKLAARWQVTRTAIFGHGGTADLKCWVQVLSLPKRASDTSSDRPLKSSPACELCGAVGVPLEGAHWIPAAQGGPASPSNILRLCPNCHTRLDLEQDPELIAQAKAVLLTRVARHFVESRGSGQRAQQLAFVALCQQVLSRSISSSHVDGPKRPGAA